MCHQLNDLRPHIFVLPKKDDRNYNIIHRALYKTLSKQTTLNYYLISTTGEIKHSYLVPKTLYFIYFLNLLCNVDVFCHHDYLNKRIWMN